MLLLAQWAAAAVLPFTGFTVYEGTSPNVFATSDAKATVIVFVSTLCPISTKYIDRLNALHNRFTAAGVQFVVANPNSNESWPAMEQYAKANGLEYKLTVDKGGALASLLGARITPEAFVYDRRGVLRYQGEIDDHSNPARVRFPYLDEAIRSVLEGRGVVPAKTTARGCAIHRGAAASK